MSYNRLQHTQIVFAFVFFFLSLRSFGTQKSIDSLLHKFLHFFGTLCLQRIFQSVIFRSQCLDSFSTFFYILVAGSVSFAPLIFNLLRPEVRLFRCVFNAIQLIKLRTRSVFVVRGFIGKAPFSLFCDRILCIFTSLQNGSRGARSAPARAVLAITRQTSQRQTSCEVHQISLPLPPRQASFPQPRESIATPKRFCTTSSNASTTFANRSAAIARDVLRMPSATRSFSKSHVPDAESGLVGVFLHSLSSHNCMAASASASSLFLPLNGGGEALIQSTATPALFFCVKKPCRGFFAFKNVSTSLQHTLNRLQLFLCFDGIDNTAVPRNKAFLLLFSPTNSLATRTSRLPAAFAERTLRRL